MKGRVGGAVAFAADAFGEGLADDDVHAVGRGDDAVGLDGDVLERRLARAIRRAFQDDLAVAALRESRAVDLHPVARLDVARRELGHLDERRGDGALAAAENDEKHAENENGGGSARGLLVLKDPVELRDFSAEPRVRR